MDGEEQSLSPEPLREKRLRIIEKSSHNMTQPPFAPSRGYFSHASGSPLTEGAMSQEASWIRSRGRERGGRQRDGAPSQRGSQSTEANVASLSLHAGGSWSSGACLLTQDCFVKSHTCACPAHPGIPAEFSLCITSGCVLLCWLIPLLLRKRR